jgi:hypothetical protein
VLSVAEGREMDMEVPWCVDEESRQRATADGGCRL